MDQDARKKSEEYAQRRYQEEVDAAKNRLNRRISAIRELAESGFEIAPPSNGVISEGLASIAKAETGEAAISQKQRENTYPSLKSACCDFVDQQKDDFTVVDVDVFLNKEWPGIVPHERRASLSSTLLGLVKEGWIHIVERGAGSRATVYGVGAEPEEDSEGTDRFLTMKNSHK